MSTGTFDTLKFAERLIAAGVPGAHAKAEAAALSEVLEINLKDVVTKEHLDHKLAELKADLIKRARVRSCNATCVTFSIGFYASSLLKTSAGSYQNAVI